MWQRKRDCTIPEVMRAVREAFPEQPALRYPFRDLSWTFAQLDARTLEAARGLHSLGVRKGDRVTVWAENLPDWIVLQIALARLGAILVTANTALKAPEIEYLLRQSESSVVCYSAGMSGNSYPQALEQIRSRLPRLKLEIFLGRQGELPQGSPALEFKDLFRHAAATPETTVATLEASQDPDEVINMQYTSGTTGFPKGVMLTHRNLVNNAHFLGKALDYRPGERLALTLPLFHCFGCVVGTLGAYVSAVTICAIDRFDPEQAVELVARERCNIIYGVPTQFRQMLEVASRGRHDLTSLRAGIMGGAPCPEELVRRLVTEFHVPQMVAAYGLTECSPGVTINDPTDSIEKRSQTVGKVIDDGIQIRVVDPTTLLEVGRGLPGELQVRGHCVMKGYYNDPKATAETILEGGWLRTGDLAILCSDNYVRIVGRIKEMIIRGGENVYPAEVEEALRRHPAVRDVAVFGVSCEIYGEEVRAAVLTFPDKSVTEGELRAFARERMAGIKVPSRFHFVDLFPMTASGKVQKFQLARMFGPVPRSP